MTKKTIDKEHLLKHFLEKEKRPFQSIGRGLNNDICYIGTYIEDDSGRFRNAVVTSDRWMYVDKGTGRNEIKNDFGLNYRDDFFADTLDTWWSNDSIRKWLFEDYTVDIKQTFETILKLNKKYMIYEDKRVHTYIALDIVRSFFHFLFSANSRTFIHAGKGSGKTNQTMIYRALCFNPISSPDFSSASIYRIIESTGGTILIDDFDQLPGEEKSKLIQHIRANYKPFKTLRADGGGKGFRPRGYNAYSHCVFNNVYGLGHDEITPDRCVIIRLLKHNDARDITVDYKNPVFQPVKDDLYVCLLQYWKEVKDAYDSIKVEELTARELELFKPLLAIAKIIGEEVYKQILDFAVEYIEQESLKDLYDDWEFTLLEHLWTKISDKPEDELIKVSVKEVADLLCEKFFGDRDQRTFKEKIYTLRSFVGGKLTGYVKFRKTRPQNQVHYHIYRKGIEEILETKRWLGLFKEELGLNLEGFEKDDEKVRCGKVWLGGERGKTDVLTQQTDINRLCDFYNNAKGKSGFLPKKSYIGFIKNVLCKKDPEKYYSELLQHNVLTDYGNNKIKFTGGYT